MSAEAKTKHRCLMVQFQCDSCTRYSRWTKLRCKVKPGEWTEHAGRVTSALPAHEHASDTCSHCGRSMRDHDQVANGLDGSVYVDCPSAPVEVITYGPGWPE
jgi:hypothetical protein